METKTFQVREERKVPKGNPGGNPELLVAAAEVKKKEAIDKTDNAIAELTKAGEAITFRSIAAKAGVSVSYLYKYEELKDRIKHLREQQQREVKKKSSQPQQYQPASDKSKAVLIYNLREENKKLRLEIEGLRKHIEVVQGRLYELSMVAEENARLQRQLEKITQELQECRSSKVVTSIPLINDSKVTSLDKKRSKRSSEISDQIKSNLGEIGVKLNTTLSKTIKSAASEEIVLFAIQALSEAIERGNVENPGGWLNAAIKDGWLPSEKHLPRQKAERDVFKEWFDLAYKQRLVLAATKGDDGQMYVYTINGAPLPFTQMLAEYPVEKLKLRN